MSGWSEERVELAKKLWQEGLSASLIASRITNSGFPVTRSAVLGKIHRMGMSGRAQMKPRVAVRGGSKRHKPRKQQPWAQFERKSAKLFQAAPFVPGPEIVVPLDQRKGILDLAENDCRWPIGDPQEPDFHFCNGRKVPGLAYCEHHARRAYQPPDVRKRPIKPQYAHTIGDPMKGAMEFFSGDAPINTGEKVDA